MEQKITNRKKQRWSTSWVVKIILLGIIMVGGWYVCCHYLPYLKSTSVSVNSEYRFGDGNSKHLAAARKAGIRPVEKNEDLKTNNLTKIESGDHYKVDRLKYSHAYLTPKAANLLDEIGTRFQAELKNQGLEKHRIIVTSVLRTGDDVKRLKKVNHNATANSAHQYATTFDITYVRFDRQSLMGDDVSFKQLANILGGVLKQLRNEGRCYVKYEHQQHCFHITSRK